VSECFLFIQQQSVNILLTFRSSGVRTQCACVRARSLSHSIRVLKVVVSAVIYQRAGAENW